MMISIIIPAHNEEKRIGPTIEAYSKFFAEEKKKNKIDYEIIIVLNACKDKTREIVEKFSKKYRNIKILEFKEGGKGFAIIRGFEYVVKNNDSNNLIGFVDADMATTPEAFLDLAKNIGKYDGIIASRYIKGAVVSPKQSIQRIIVSRMFNILIRTIFFIPYRDTQCGAKIFMEKAIKKVLPKLIITHYAFDVDLLYQLRKNNFKIYEFPTVWSDKEYSKINFMNAGPKMVLAAIRLRLLNSPFKYFVRLYDKIF